MLSLIENYIEQGDLNCLEMTAKLLCSLETTMTMHRAMKEIQYYAVASNAKALIKLVGLEAKKSYIGVFEST